MSRSLLAAAHKRLMQQEGSAAPGTLCFPSAVGRGSSMGGGGGARTPHEPVTSGQPLPQLPTVRMFEARGFTWPFILHLSSFARWLRMSLLYRA